MKLMSGRCARPGCAHPNNLHSQNDNRRCLACEGCMGYLEPSQGVMLIPTKFEDSELAGWTGPGWYFWTEDQAHCIGPYDSGQEAMREQEAYAKMQNRPKGMEKTLALAFEQFPSLQEFAIDVAIERQNQQRLHPGTEDLPDSTDNPGGRRTWEDIARRSEKRAANEGRLTFAYVFDEEAAEVLTAAAEGDIEKLKKELIQVSAVCFKWLQAIDRREKQVEAAE